MGGAVVGEGVVVVAGVVEVVCGLSAARATGGKGLVTAAEGGGEAAFCCCCCCETEGGAAADEGEATEGPLDGEGARGAPPERGIAEGEGAAGLVSVVAADGDGAPAVFIGTTGAGEGAEEATSGSASDGEGAPILAAAGARAGGPAGDEAGRSTRCAGDSAGAPALGAIAGAAAGDEERAGLVARDGAGAAAAPPTISAEPGKGLSGLSLTTTGGRRRGTGIGT